MKSFLIFATLLIVSMVMCDETDTEKKMRDIIYDSLPSDTVDADKKLRDVEEAIDYDRKTRSIKHRQVLGY
jgi:hypothetical protein